ncbi:MAG: type II toxin-antitoxin system HipA family toxin [Bacteroidota bacterium]
MATIKTDVWVFADWAGMAQPKCIGMLSAQYTKGRRNYSFEYDPFWLQSKEQLILDPDIGWFSGVQFPNRKDNFGMFLDSMPDTWGRTLMKRRSAMIAKKEGKAFPVLHDIDFLLGVQDECRMGALRFKLDKDGPFVDYSKDFSVPPWTSAIELQHSVEMIESNENNEEMKSWLAVLVAPGSSLGGARPKASIIDKSGQLWIAKFPSKNDSYDKAAWEFLAFRLAILSGIEMAESKLQIITGKYHTFFTKRFDRIQRNRIHFASAMTMIGKNEIMLRDEPASYLELAEFIKFSGAENKKDLHQLWRRIVFNIMISNTDDHPRNHGFILTDRGWRLSPAFDVNPSVEKDGLSMNIDMDNNALDIDLAKSVAQYFMLSNDQAEKTIREIRFVVGKWKSIAKEIGIKKAELENMESAFRT